MSNARPRPPVVAPERPGRDLSKPLPPAVSWITLLVFAVGFAVTYLVFGLAWWVPVLYGAASLVTFAAYGIDKSAARRGAARISEQTLLLLGLVGGWPEGAAWRRTQPSAGSASSGQLTAKVEATLNTRRDRPDTVCTGRADTGIRSCGS